MESLKQDLAYGFRTLVKNPGFTIVAVLALALGTGANTAIFSVVNGVLLKPLPYQDPDQLVMVWTNNTKANRAQDVMSVPDLLDYRENSVFEQIATLSFDDFNLTEGDQPERVPGTMVSANFFSTLGVRPQLGRTFLPEEDQAGADPVVIISDGLWKRSFGADAEILNRVIQLNGASFTVVGVTRAEFQSPEKGDELWVPMSFDGTDRLRIPSVSTPEDLKNRMIRFFKCVARLKPGVTLSQAQAEMSTIASRLEQQYPDSNAGMGINLVPLHRQIVGDIKPALQLLLAAVGLVLLIACANVANLLLARASARRKEIAIRVALGASRSRLIRQLLTESVMLALIGGALGAGLAWLGLRLLVGTNPANIPRLGEIGIDSRVLGFTLVVSLLTGLVFGLVPALQASRPDLNETLKEGSRGSTGGIGRRRTHSVLVVTEIALTQILLIGAGVTMRNFYLLQKVNPGFNSDSVLTMQVTLPPLKYAEDTQRSGFYEQAVKRIEALPGVQSAAAVTTLPLTGSIITRRFTIDGRPPAAANERLVATYAAISPEYFRAMGIRLISGRSFTDHDRDTSQQVIIVNDTLRRRFWPNEDPIGKHISITAQAGISREIVGVVEDVKHSSLDAEPGLQIYEPCLQSPWNFMAILVRTAGDPQGMAAAVRTEILAVDRAQPVYDVKTMAQILGDSVSQPRLYMWLLGTFAAIALVLAGVGIYGVMNYSVKQRTHEIGIRMALGADRYNILRMVIGRAMVLVGSGLALGILGWFVPGVSGKGVEFFLTSAKIPSFVARLTRPLLDPMFELMNLLYTPVSTSDVVPLGALTLLLAIVALGSAYLPARRATRVDPMIALRAE